MGEKEGVQTLEKGNIYFFYRPKIDVGEDISRADDVQNLYFILSPHSDSHYRMVNIGKDALPKDSRKERSWGFVTRATSSKNQIREELKSYTYKTKTRGERENPAARPCGEGVYRIVRHDDHSHLVYALEFPGGEGGSGSDSSSGDGGSSSGGSGDGGSGNSGSSSGRSRGSGEAGAGGRPGRVQRALNIREEGNYIVSVKNPGKGQPENAGLSKDQQADFPKRLQKKFDDRRFVPLEPDFLNYENAELVFIGVGKEVRQELGIDLQEDGEGGKGVDLFKDLGLDRDEHPVQPLFEGEWG